MREMTANAFVCIIISNCSALNSLFNRFVLALYSTFCRLISQYEDKIRALEAELLHFKGGKCDCSRCPVGTTPCHCSRSQTAQKTVNMTATVTIECPPLTSGHCHDHGHDHESGMDIGNNDLSRETHFTCGNTHRRPSTLNIDCGSGSGMSCSDNVLPNRNNRESVNLDGYSYARVLIKDSPKNVKLKKGCDDENGYEPAGPSGLTLLDVDSSGYLKLNTTSECAENSDGESQSPESTGAPSRVEHATELQGISTTTETADVQQGTSEFDVDHLKPREDRDTDPQPHSLQSVHSQEYLLPTSKRDAQSLPADSGCATEIDATCSQTLHENQTSHVERETIHMSLEHVSPAYHQGNHGGEAIHVSIKELSQPSEKDTDDQQPECLPPKSLPTECSFTRVSFKRIHEVNMLIINIKLKLL